MNYIAVSLIPNGNLKIKGDPTAFFKDIGLSLGIWSSLDRAWLLDHKLENDVLARLNKAPGLKRKASAFDLSMGASFSPFYTSD